jgi:hypothetical protein
MFKGNLEPLVLQSSEPSTPESEERQSKTRLEIFKVVNDHYRNDINAVWHRSQFFMVTDLGLLAFFYSAAFKRDNITNVQWLAGIGLIISLVWVCIMLWTIRWIDVWRHAVVDMEKSLVPFGPFNRGESIGGGHFHEKLRPENFSLGLAGMFALLWFLVLLELIQFS